MYSSGLSFGLRPRAAAKPQPVSRAFPPGRSSERLDQLAEALAALLVVGEGVEARAGGGEQDGLAGPGRRRRLRARRARGRRSGAAGRRPARGRRPGDPPPRRSDSRRRSARATAGTSASKPLTLEAAAEDRVEPAAEGRRAPAVAAATFVALESLTRRRRRSRRPARAGAGRRRSCAARAATASRGTPAASAAAATAIALRRLCSPARLTSATVDQDALVVADRARLEAERAAARLRSRRSRTRRRVRHRGDRSRARAGSSASKTASASAGLSGEDPQLRVEVGVEACRGDRDGRG